MTFQNRFSFGLMGVSGAEPVELPLRRVLASFRVDCGAVYVEMEQVFHQTHTETLDCDYTFPLPEGALVHRCEFQIGKRVVRAKAMETGEARRLQAQKAADGRRTALVDYVRENLFHLSLSNVQPGDLVVVRLAYCENLKAQGLGFRLRIPLSPGRRYVPLVGEVPDAERINPPRIDSGDPRNALLSVRGSLDSREVDPSSLQSPTHPVLARLGELSVQVALASANSVPDSDFVLEWKGLARLSSQGWVWRRGGESFGLARLCAPEGIPDGPVAPGDYYFLVDRSGSMDGAKWEKSCEAVRNLVSKLRMQDRAWLCLFESSFIDVTKRPIPVGELVRREAFRRFEELGVEGGTELLPAARHAFEVMRTHSQDTRKVLVLITDGQVGNEEEVLGSFEHAELDFEVCVFGIDDAVNDALLEELARRHRGMCALLTPQDDIPAAVAELAGRLSSPVFSQGGLGYEWEHSGGGSLSLYAGQSFLLNLHSAATPDRLILKGLSRTGGISEQELPLVEVNNPALELLWWKTRIQVLQRQNRREEVIALAVKANLLTRWTSYLAWDEAEQVPVALKTVHQPSATKLRDCVACAGGPCDVVLIAEAEEDAGEARTAFLTSLDARVKSLGLPQELERFVRTLSRRHTVGKTEIPAKLEALFMKLQAGARQPFEYVLHCQTFLREEFKDGHEKKFLMASLEPMEVQLLIELGL